MIEDLRPNPAEIEFLTLAYNRFYNIFEEVMDDSFFEKDEWNRFSKIKEGFAIYSELLNYEPIGWAIEQMRKTRPPNEAEIGSDLFKTIRNIIIHFPFFESWDEVWFSKRIINWNKEGKSIDRFLKKCRGKETVKYRIWEEQKKKMTYLSVNFPQKYEDESKIYLKNILSEKEGVKFSFILMKNIIDTQILN
ncbi:hypothetical protein [Methanosarcina sp. UBA5]|uniref:hypothetical protein n=1 Tax=Methanosarcina sp. UBA5 TaxID=1915593 RepID=UPI0025FF89A5|nr:hypothetical protein [Methanosarcina sp. UBA5]